MTLEELQSALWREKSEEEEICGYDLCGSYGRCDFCDRGEDLSCARAYLKLLRSPEASVPAWKLPEPDVRWEDPAPPAEAEPAEVAEAPAEPIVLTEEPAVSAEEPAEPEPAPAEARKKVLKRGERGAVRLAVFRRK